MNTKAILTGMWTPIMLESLQTEWTQKSIPDAWTQCLNMVPLHFKRAKSITVPTSNVRTNTHTQFQVN